MRFLVSQEPNIRRSKKVNFFSVSFGRVPPKKVKMVSVCGPKKVKMVSVCLLRIGKRKEWRKQNSYHTILVCSVPNKERIAQLSIAQHLTDSRRVLHSPGNQTSEKSKSRNFISNPFPPFSRQPNGAIKIRTISSGYDMVTVTVWSTGGAASDVHDIFWQEIRQERHWLNDDGGRNRTGAENSMRDRLL